MRVNELGNIVKEQWVQTGVVRGNIEMDEFQLMPNHFHGILVMDDSGRGTARRALNGYDNHGGHKGTARRAPTVEQFAKPVAGSLPTIIRSFKSSVTKNINELRNTPGLPVWQRNYDERIIRNENELHAIRQYIIENPLKWDLDSDNPLANAGILR